MYKFKVGDKVIGYTYEFNANTKGYTDRVDFTGVIDEDVGDDTYTIYDKMNDKYYIIELGSTEENIELDTKLAKALV